MSINDSQTQTTEAQILTAVLRLQEVVARMDTRIEQIVSVQAKQESFADRLTKIETRMDMAEKVVGSNRWLIALVVGILMGVISLAASHMTWH